MKNISLLQGYIYLILAIIAGIASNGFLKTTEGSLNLILLFFALQVSLFVYFFYPKQ